MQEHWVLALVTPEDEESIIVGLSLSPSLLAPNSFHSIPVQERRVLIICQSNFWGEPGGTFLRRFGAAFTMPFLYHFAIKVQDLPKYNIVTDVIAKIGETCIVSILRERRRGHTFRGRKSVPTAALLRRLRHGGRQGRYGGRVIAGSLFLPPIVLFFMHKR